MSKLEDQYDGYERINMLKCLLLAQDDQRNCIVTEHWNVSICIQALIHVKVVVYSVY